MSTPESANTERFKGQIRTEWTDAAMVEAWWKWHPKFVIASREVTEAIVQAAQERGIHLSSPSVGVWPGGFGKVAEQFQRTVPSWLRTRATDSSRYAVPRRVRKVL